MTATRDSLPRTLLATALGIAIGVLATLALVDTGPADARADATVQEARVAPSDAGGVPRPVALAPPASHRTAAPAAGAAGAVGRDAPGLDVDQALKDLLTLAWNDRRNMREKLDDFLVEHPDRVGVAVASKGVFDLADNRDVLPDDALAALYLDQHDSGFKRVLAQVASARGDNSLIELHVADVASGLHSTTPGERQQALVELSRTRHVAAADLAAPLLRDGDSSVVLDALLVLRNAGNQRHLAMVEGLARHDDASVRWLARDVADELRMLSDVARTRVSAREMASELPPLPLPQPEAIQCGLAHR